MIGEIGFRIEQNIERASKEQMEALKPFACAQLSDGLNKFYTMDSGIMQMFPADKFIGTAITVKTRSADNLMLHKAISLIKPGDVLVIDTQGCVNYSLMGELMVSSMEKLGLVGIVADGCIRDIEDLEKIGLPVFARGTTPAVGDKDGPGEINVPICCGGVVVMPGDVIVADSDGIVVIPKADLDVVAKKAEKKAFYESKRREAIARGELIKADVDELLAKKGLIITEGEK